ncbi:MAG: carboxylating nicotinate-nucleotide diphosphorylase [Limnospira sp. PMC 1291.21]|uniref:carboxylating nicotinate-nucleotide diphosphorylase n=1 Tax=unclassified Limnospira TaxID=2642885 RepID=UPI0028E0E8CD|nr:MULTISPECIES: carboxylating nicotinate-nucleotide diphosphorylase [unclassified Limnospira]MDT9179936.1 carboxylating nicotinate-nucleotide diphosphorylase [Limnospira sp. PMC 1238.20]MDT9195317.1 carboxylating nicotinate-nucleotide diphosphorylase [Limnospira sp. PMC 1245.20]MDT9205538.1 carboxylating nicotinate-nucleotide diphosphorylase [Limnospira sp. PMC 1243.20]MDT9210704.1 carboxylating nicotinate-nucleotide diphosphorylase [Limnospira sp. PMC 1252.20]MDT9215683.1 carboxylating nicot
MIKPKSAILPPWIVLDPLLKQWLTEDIGRGDRTTDGLLRGESLWGTAHWSAKAPGIMAGLAVAARVFQLLSDRLEVTPTVKDGDRCDRGQVILQLEGPLDALLMGERVALNLAMRLSGVATSTREYVDAIADLPTQLVDTRKTTPGLRLLEKYAVQVGGAKNHRMGLDDAVLIKDNHILAAGGIEKAIALIRETMPYPLTIEVETETIEQVKTAVNAGADIIMLDNMSVAMMQEAIEMIRQYNSRIKIEASGNITLQTIRQVAEIGVDYISTSATITRSPWLDISMNLGPGNLGINDPSKIRMI